MRLIGSVSIYTLGFEILGFKTFRLCGVGIWGFRVSGFKDLGFGNFEIWDLGFLES